MMCVRLQKDDKTIRLYNRKNFVVLLCTFIPTVEWWNQLENVFDVIIGHGYDEVEMSIIFIENAKISDVYEIVKNQNWWQNGETVDKK